MKHSISPQIIAFLLLICTTTTLANILEIKHDEYKLTKEKELKVVIEVAFGSITIERGDKTMAAMMDYENGNDKEDFDISYEIVGETGKLKIKMKKATYTWGEGDDEDDAKEHRHRKRHLHLKLSDAVPTTFDIELGAGKGDFDFTDLQVKDIKISAGASSVTLKCNKPNAIAIDDISIESGVSKFSGKNLGNLNFHKMKFSGGLGSYKLDFSGAFHRKAIAKIDVGLGSVNVYIPKTTPAKVIYEDSWLSSFSIDDAFENIKENVYVTPDFENAEKSLTIELDAGLGNVSVSR